MPKIARAVSIVQRNEPFLNMDGDELDFDGISDQTLALLYEFMFPVASSNRSQPDQIDASASVLCDDDFDFGETTIVQPVSNASNMPLVPRMYFPSSFGGIHVLNREISTVAIGY